MGMCIHRLSPIKKIAARGAVAGLMCWKYTLRLQIDEPSLALLERYRKQPKICVLWHNRLFATLLLWKRYFSDHPMYGLISPSKDGAWLTEAYAILGIRAIRGSSRRNGEQALREARTQLLAGNSVTLTPDGPRGPRYQVKPGIGFLAKETCVPILVGGIHYSKAWRLHSWDKFYLPRPFSKVQVTLKAIDPKEYSKLSEEAIRSRVEDELWAMNAKSHVR